MRAHAGAHETSTLFPFAFFAWYETTREGGSCRKRTGEISIESSRNLCGREGWDNETSPTYNGRGGHYHGSHNHAWLCGGVGTLPVASLPPPPPLPPPVPTFCTSQNCATQTTCCYGHRSMGLLTAGRHSTDWRWIRNGGDSTKDFEDTWT